MESLIRKTTAHTESFLNETENKAFAKFKKAQE